MELREKLKVLRKRAGLTKEKVAEKLCLSPKAISRWEKGEADPSPDTLNYLSELYHVPVNILLDENAELPEGQEPAHSKRAFWRRFITPT